MEKIINQPREYVPVSTAMKIKPYKGMSRPTILHGLETGRIKGIKTETGHWRVFIGDAEDTSTTAIVEQLNEQGRLLKALCGHLGVL